LIEIILIMPKHHIVITGTGRAGTTFLLQLLTELGLGTGYTPDSFEIAEHCNVGSEWDIRRSDAPYIVKSPWLCDSLESVIELYGIVVDHAIIPVRDLYSAAESRRDVSRRTPLGIYPVEVPGGLMYTIVPELQEIHLAEKQHKLLCVLAKHDIPHSLLHFPRLVLDAEYLYPKISQVFKSIEYSSFERAFRKISRPELVRNFNAPA